MKAKRTPAADGARIYLKLLALASPVLLGSAVSVAVDPDHRFHSRQYSARIAHYLVSGYNVIRTGEIDERMLQQQFIDSLVCPPPLAIFGSSRIMTLSSDDAGRNLINNGVSNASLNDILTIYQFYRRRRLVPRSILIDVDPWMLNEAFDEKGWLSEWRDLSAIRKDLRLPSIRSGTFAELSSRLHLMASPGYVGRSAAVAFYGSSLPSQPPNITHARFNAGRTRLSDGAITYGAQYRQRSSDETRVDVRKFLSVHPHYGFRGFISVTAAQREALSLLLRLMRKEGAQPLIVLMPYHPRVFPPMNNNEKFVSLDEIENEIRSIAGETGVSVSGSYSPLRAGVADSDFVDAIHLKPAAVAVMARRALGPAPVPMKHDRHCR